MRTRIFLAILAALSLPRSTQAAPAAPSPSSGGRLRMDIWRYHGHREDFSRASLAILMQEETGRFKTLVSGYVTESSRFVPYDPSWATIAQALGPFPIRDLGYCGSLLHDSQKFALEVMRRRHAITEEDYEEQLRIFERGESGLRPDQVTFIEISSPGPADAPIEDQALLQFDRSLSAYAPLPGEEGPDGEPAETARDIKRSTIWVLGGQSVDERGELVFHRLPLQGHAGSRWPVEIDRGEHPLVWELGRGAQVAPGLIEHNLRAAAAIAHNELRYLGGRLEDGWVFVHSLDDLHTSIYTHRYGGEVHACNPERPGETVIKIRLGRLLERFAPEDFLDDLRDFKDQFKDQVGHGIRGIDLLELRDRAKVLLSARYDLRASFGRARGQGLELRDFSGLERLAFSRLVRDWAGERGIDLGGNEASLAASLGHITRRDLSRRDAFEWGWQGLGHRFEEVRELFARKNAIELYGLEPQALREHPDAYVPGSLLAAWAELKRRLARLGVADPAGRLRSQEIRLGVLTMSDEISLALSRVAEELGAKEAIEPTWLELIPERYKVNTAVFFTGGATYEKVQSRVIKVAHFFSVDDLERLERERPELAAEARDALRLGLRQFRSFLEHPRQF